MATAARLYPLFAALEGRGVLVAGGGVVADRKVRALLGTGARVIVGAPELSPALAHWHDEGLIDWRRGAFEPAWLDDVWLVVAATSDPDVNRAIAAEAASRRLFANVVDDSTLSTFHVPAIVDRSPLQIAISSGGAAPMLARSLRERLESMLDHALGPLAALFERLRAAVRSRQPELPERREFYERALRGPALSLLRAGQEAEAERALRAALEAPVDGARGRVALVGAGPGDPGLLTLRGLRLLNEADVILHDRLVSDEILELARRDAERIEVGKQAGSHRFSQKQINDLMLQYARAGYRVVRLKGGDPFVFGRGGEELEFLRAHAIPYEVVPGITAAIGGASYAGIPLTHRDHAHSVQFVTGHGREPLGAPDWTALAQPDQTLAIYMGVAQLAEIRERLLAAGRAGSTPVAIVENGTRGEQRVIVTQLCDLDGCLAERHRLVSPALLIVGDVAALAERLAWFGAPPIRDGGIEATQNGARQAA